MKRILLLLLLAVAGIMQAQIVNIPDPYFKSLLLSADSSQATAKDVNGNYITIDVNNDLEIQVSEAAQVHDLYIIGGETNSLVGIEAFVNLRTLFISTSFTAEVILPGLPSLQELTLHYINNSADNPTVLNVGNLSNLKKLACQEADYVNIAGIEILQALEDITIDGSVLLNDSLDFSGLTNLISIYIRDTFIDLNIGDKPNLQTLLVDYNQGEIILGAMPSLVSFDVDGLYMTQVLDLSGSPYLNKFDCNTDALYINLKNGNSSYESFHLAILPQTYICIDQGEEVYFTGQNYNFSTYCTFTPGSTYNVITGSLLFDNESDGCDSNDGIISNIKLNIANETESYTTISSTGLYNFYTQAGAYNVTPEFENGLFTITPPFAEINFTEVDSLVTTQNFCITPNGNHPDLDIVIVPFGAQPGFDANYKIIYRNKGNQTLSGDIVFAYGEDVLDFVSANPSEDSSSSGTLTWNYTNLAPFQQREIFVTLNVNGPMETPAVNIDDNLYFTATINPVTGDETPLDNVFGLKQTVIGSFDPNDITCLEGDSVNPDRIGEYLHYNINFENTGTAPATFIVVKDVIDITQFDMATLQMLNASHPVQAKITGNKVEFRFDTINLGAGEKGNVIFKIKTLNTLQANDDVTQKADIFFDYNWPIATNDATTVFEILSRDDFSKDTTVKVYPNPSNGIVNISAVSLIKSVELYDVQGRLLQIGSNASLDISGRASGMYFIKVFTENGMKVEKIVKK